MLRRHWNIRFTRTRRSRICFTALGVTIEEKEGERVLNIEKLRYHKIVHHV